VTFARQSLGRSAEGLVARRLTERGWRVLARNARVHTEEFSGELDIVALEGRTLVFVEVKAATRGRGAGPERAALAVGRRKRLRLRRLAVAWLGDRPSLPGGDAIRFDVVGVTLARDGGLVDYDHLRNAF
jgi:putative endonuclease